MPVFSQSETAIRIRWLASGPCLLINLATHSPIVFSFQLSHVDKCSLMQKCMYESLLFTSLSFIPFNRSHRWLLTSCKDIYDHMIPMGQLSTPHNERQPFSPLLVSLRDLPLQVHWNGEIFAI